MQRNSTLATYEDSVETLDDGSGPLATDPDELAVQGPTRMDSPKFSTQLILQRAAQQAEESALIVAVR